MAVTLDKLYISIEEKYNMKLVAGKDGLKNVIRWVHMVEDSEVPNFLHGNELIFTTGIGRLDTADKILEFVQGLQKHNAAGLVMNLGPYIKKVPTVVVDYCERNGFPLFTLPWEVKIIDITYDMCRMIIENEKSEISATEAFKAIISGERITDEYTDALKKMGFHSKNKYRVAVMDFMLKDKKVTETFVGNNHIRLWKLLSRTAATTAMFVMHHRLVVVKQNCGDAQIKRMSDTIQKSIDAGNMTLVMGVSDEKSGPEAVNSLYKQARAAYYTACSKSTGLEYYENIGLNQLIFGVEDKEILKSFVNRQLAPLIDYDVENNTDYVETFKDYLESYSSVKTVSEKSHVHRNTINYKIKQIREILGGELDAEAKAEFLIAYKIKDLLDYL